MANVVAYIETLSGAGRKAQAGDNLVDETGVAMGGTIVHAVSTNITIAAGTTRLFRYPNIAPNVEITIEADGEMLVL